MFNTYFAPPRPDGIDFTDSPTMTEQHHKDSLDPNKIIDNVIRTGSFEHLNLERFASYADATTAGSFLDAQLAYRRGMEAFEALPAHIRTRFNNDPAQLLTFLENPENRAEAEKLGIVEKFIAPESPAVVPETSLDLTGTTDTVGGTPQVS